MNFQHSTAGLDWRRITGMRGTAPAHSDLPHGILVPDTRNQRDRVAVVYAKGHPPPEITVEAISGTVTSVLADGVAVAVIARASGPDLSPEDVLLVERAQ